MAAPDRVAEHVAAFNASIHTGDWAGFARRFAPGATMSFVGVPAGTFTGRDAIAAGYLQQPPTDTLAVRDVVSHDDIDTVAFAWSSGGTGSMTLRWDGASVSELVVSFDD